MASSCPSCHRSVAVAGAAFCSYCGGKLSDPHATVEHLADSGSHATETVLDTLDRIGGYRILRHLGEGGMGSVYEAEADESGQRVAVKLLSSKLSANPVSVERFKQEGRLASQISHPRCVFVYRADADDGRPFIVMELMPGLTLKDAVERHGRFAPTVAVARILDVVDGLIEAHRLGLIHRDVKPSNCFLTDDDRVKVGDFGLSKSLIESEGEGQLTGTGAFLGTVLFAAPEQIRGEDVSYDSDVYSVCATLYYLLAGRAPYQHESVTAALAKAISEPPPPLRETRPDVPKALDQLVLRGLERDRKRRFNSLEDLRDALQSLQPEEQIPARTRMLAAAYILDSLLTIFLVSLPIELLEWATGLRAWLFDNDAMMDPMNTLGLLLYFAIGDGVFGATLGKWLLGLRVVPYGSVGPPGFGAAVIRTGVFHFGWLLIWTALVPISLLPSAIALPVGLVLIVAGVGYLAYRVRSPGSNRGLHDLASKTHVVQVPRRPHRVRLTTHAPPRLDRVARVPGIPRIVGGYVVRGRLAQFGDAHEVWLADDRSLGRRILLDLVPVETESIEPPSRHNRLRLIGQGELDWEGRDWRWNGFAAPNGAPLRDLIRKDQPLNWPDARLIIEQTVEELLASGNDGTLPPTLSLSHVWAEPNGRVMLLDVPIPPTMAEPTSPDVLVREVITLLLEGEPRADRRAVRAPLPARVMNVLNTYVQNETPLESFQCDLADTHGQEPTVTRKIRTTQVGIAMLLLAVPLVVMFLFTTLFGFVTASLSWQILQAARAVDRGIEDPATRDRWQKYQPLSVDLGDEWPTTRARFKAGLEHADREFVLSLERMSKPERYVLGQWIREAEQPPPPTDPEVAHRILRRITSPARDLNSREFRYNLWLSGAIVCGIIAAGFAITAFLFRGGLSYWLGGVALVRRDGRPANRFVCAVRELAIWLPLVALLLLIAFVQLQWPGAFWPRLVLTALAFMLLVVYLAEGLRHPEQGWLDRLFGVTRVPA